MDILNKGKPKPKHMKPRRRWRTPLTALAVAASMAVAPAAMAALNGIDTSSWQTADVTCTVADYDFAVVKLTQGTGYRNPKSAAQLKCAQNRGKKIGAYHYAAGGDPVAEADFFIAALGGWRGQALLALDFEMGDNPVYYSASAGDWIRTWVTRVHSVTGVWPVIYLPESGVGKVPSDVRAHCGIWPAAYATMLPTGWQSSPWHGGKFGEAMRQYTSEGVLAGYSGRLDLNIFYGDGAAWDAYARGGRNAASVKPAPKPSAPASRQLTPQPVIRMDGRIGVETVSQWQRVMGTPVDGVISGQYRVGYRPSLYSVSYGRHHGSTLIRAVQRKLGVRVDGLLGPQTIRAMQRRLGVRVDGILGPQTALALQIALNQGRF
ncbi:GH25 family lysozyme [uncultured Bifidobacterium sp.]|uniref:GH25 family lysozyme n=1 Tax=uncultured Bifidobacterium sp. TaxID=165187 RepID=UPI00258B8927|nr:GH25 family lysozyme [uncultured Bifidobacterium sp.]